MSHCLFILGAGASKPGGCPVMDDFFGKAERLYKSLIRSKAPISRLEQSDYERIEAFREHLYQCQLNVNIDVKNLEAVYNTIEFDSLVSDRPPSSRDDLRSVFRRYIKSTLHRTQALRKIGSCRSINKLPLLHFQDLSIGHQIGGVHGYVELCWLCKFLLEEGHTCDIITFNYDVGFEITAAYQHLDYSYSAKNPLKSGVRVFKPHGSVNWYESLPLNHSWTPNDQWFSINNEQIVEIDKQWYFLDLPSDDWADDEVRLGGPLIVPPSDSKGDYRSGFEWMWRLAKESLSLADMVTVAGFSLPKTDQFFRNFFFVALAERPQKKRIYFFNPDAAARQEFTNLMGRAVIHRNDEVLAAHGQLWPNDAINMILDDYINRAREY